jgi:hypothetical protein
MASMDFNALFLYESELKLFYCLHTQCAIALSNDRQVGHCQRASAPAAAALWRGLQVRIEFPDLESLSTVTCHKSFHSMLFSPKLTPFKC